MSHGFISVGSLDVNSEVPSLQRNRNRKGDPVFRGKAEAGSSSGHPGFLGLLPETLQSVGREFSPPTTGPPALVI